ncbi:MAG: carbohydrate ABC transporter permease [Alicyclobacillus sp.]|nr:carbohydrate ABC transporter permease [Alicyclobacillus sp.]
MPRMAANLLRRLVRSSIILLMAAVSLIPFYILLVIALSSPGWHLAQRLSLWPEFLLGNFTAAWRASGMGIAILNSIFITFGALAVVVFAAGAAGYAIARFPHRLHRLLFKLFLFSMMIPPIINTVPLYTLMRSIGGINTRWAMILVCGSNALPFSIFLYTSFIQTMSREIEEAAIVDGCTWFSAFWRVTFPLLWPVTAAVVIINGLGIWNNYAQAVFFLQRSAVRTIPLAISLFFQQYGARWNLMAAAAAIGMAPAVIAFLVFQRYFIKGLSTGALKG